MKTDKKSVVRETELLGPKKVTSHLRKKAKDPASVVRENELKALKARATTPYMKKKSADPNSVVREGEFRKKGY